MSATVKMCAIHQRKPDPLKQLQKLSEAESSRSSGRSLDRMVAGAWRLFSLLRCGVCQSTGSTGIRSGSASVSLECSFRESRHPRNVMKPDKSSWWSVSDAKL